MNAMVLEMPGRPLAMRTLPIPTPNPSQVLIRVEACAVCRTDLHIVDGELPVARLPLIPGHEVVGTVIECGAEAARIRTGDRVGVPWLGWTCGACSFCQSGRENLCDHAQFTGYHLHGGYAEYCVADARYVLPVPSSPSPEEVAPLLCAGLIGYRALRMAGDAQRLGLYGFGASAHLLTQIATQQGRKVFAFTRPRDLKGQRFARRLGAVWADGSDTTPPEPLDAAIIFAPVGALIPVALRAVDKGGKVICAGIHMSDLPAFPYALLWQERSVQSVANLTRQDGADFLALIPRLPLRTEVTAFTLAAANDALNAVRLGTLEGAAVLRIAASDARPESALRGGAT